jgi:hypothetical protein
VVDVSGNVLGAVETGHDDGSVEDTIDELNIEYLDALLDPIGDDFMGTKTIDMATAERW